MSDGTTGGRGRAWWIYWSVLVVLCIASIATMWHELASDALGAAALVPTLLLAALLLMPIFSEVSIGGITLKREILQTRKELGQQIVDLRTAVTTNLSYSPRVNLEVRNEIERQISRSQIEAVAHLSRIDLKLIPLWESEHSSIPGRSGVKKLELLLEEVGRYEELFEAAEGEDRAQYAMVLRPLYWELLDSARKGYASSRKYHEIKGRIQNGLNRLAEMEPV